MPVWHDETKALRQEGKIHVIGVIQEQHPDRCRLFMQWKQMDWPVLVDSLNLLQVSVVPIALLLDEQGIVREVLRDPRKLTERLDALGANPAATSNGEVPPASNDVLVLQQAQHALMLSEPPNIEKALRALDDALRRDERIGALHFARGVAYRMRYDSPQRQRGDFAAAVEGWQQALDIDPNQYIWRRRIQQYGPRLDKPYPFYDWVEAARRDIQTRGETPVALTVEPVGAELAGPAQELAPAASHVAEPDPDGRITRDSTPLVVTEITVIPARIQPGQAARVHVEFRANRRAEGHWNNEGQPLVVWVNPPPSWSISDRRLSAPNAPQPVSDESRRIEFELRAPDEAQPGATRALGYAIYGVCEGLSGTCLLRRADLVVPLEIIPAR